MGNVEFVLVGEQTIHLDWTQRIEVAVKIPSPANGSRYGLSNHMAAASLRARQREVVKRDLGFLLKRPALPCVVKLERVSKCPLDGDNLQFALKAVRDGVADWLGINDRDKRCLWTYGQIHGKHRTASQKRPGYQAVIVTVRSRRPDEEGAAE